MHTLTHQLPALNLWPQVSREVDSRSIYASPFPFDATLDALSDFFRQHGAAERSCAAVHGSAVQLRSLPSCGAHGCSGGLEGCAVELPVGCRLVGQLRPTCL